MQKFILRLTIFGAGLWSLAFMVDHVVTRGLMKIEDAEFQEFSTLSAICSSSIDADVLIMGSSVAYRLVNPFILDTILKANTYNIGLAGAEAFEQHVGYMTFEKYNQKPRCIIQVVDFFFLRQQKGQKSVHLSMVDDDIDHRFVPFYPFLKKRKYLAGASILMTYIPLYRYYYWKDELLLRGWQAFFKNHPVINRKGFFETDLEWDGTRLRNILQQDSLVAGKNPEAIELFDSYLSHCKENNIQIIIVLAPMYVEASDYVKDKVEVKNIYRSLSEKYDIPFIDYSTGSINSDTTYFFNSTHVNKKGSIFYSTKLAQYIDSLGILN